MQTLVRLAEVELARLHEAMLTASRAAGKAEVAADVLHNLGNVLNSVNASASLLATRPKDSAAPNLVRVAALLEDHAATLPEFLTADQPGRQLPDYLTRLAEVLVAQHQQTVDELASLRESLERVIDIVATRQRHLRPRSPQEPGAA